MAGTSTSKTVHPLHEFYLTDSIGLNKAGTSVFSGWFQSKHHGAIFTGEAKTRKGKGIHVRLKIYSPRYRTQASLVADRMVKLGYVILGQLSVDPNKIFTLPDTASPLFPPDDGA